MKPQRNPNSGNQSSAVHARDSLRHSHLQAQSASHRDPAPLPPQRRYPSLAGDRGAWRPPERWSRPRSASAHIDEKRALHYQPRLIAMIAIVLIVALLAAAAAA